MGKVGVLVQTEILPERVEDFRRLYTDYLEVVRQLPGVEYSYIMESKDEPGVFVIYESWHSQEDYSRHLQSESNRKFAETIQGMFTMNGFIKNLVPFL